MIQVRVRCSRLRAFWGCCHIHISKGKEQEGLPLPAGEIIMVIEGKRKKLVYLICFPKVSGKAQAA